MSPTGLYGSIPETIKYLMFYYEHLFIDVNSSTIHVYMHSPVSEKVSYKMSYPIAVTITILLHKLCMHAVYFCKNVLCPPKMYEYKT